MHAACLIWNIRVRTLYHFNIIVILKQAQFIFLFRISSFRGESTALNSKFELQRFFNLNIVRNGRSAETDEEYWPRQDVHVRSTVFDLVYRYLRKIADKDRRWKQRNCACDQFHRQHARRKNVRGRGFSTTARRTACPGAEIGDGGRNERPSATFGICSGSSRECIADYAKAVRDGKTRGGAKSP